MALRLSGDGDLEILDTTLTNVTASNLSASVVSASGTVTLPSTTSIGAVSSTELEFVDGVTSAIQTQLGNRVLTTGGSTITAANASTVGVTVKGAASQTADLIRARNSSDTNLFRVEKDGLISGSGPSLGAWTSFTPTWTNLTVGNALFNVGQYCKIGRTVFAEMFFQFGSTTTVNGVFYPALPTGSTGSISGYGWAFDSSATVWNNLIFHPNSYLIGDGGARYAATFPFPNWSTPDFLLLTVVYQASS